MNETLQELKNGIKHIFYIYSHPFDGFWIMKHEKKGNMKTAFLIFLLLIITTTYRILGSAYLFTSPTLAKFSVGALVLAVAVLVALYCVANWALTTLWEGSGSIKDIFMVLMYSLTPLVIVNVPLTLLTHIIVLDEAVFYSLINTITVIWMVFLILAGNLSIHEYTMTKSVITTIVTVAAMIGIGVLFILLFNLAQEVFMWFKSVAEELILRLV